MNLLTGIGGRLGTVRELFVFLMERKLWWMIPLALSLVLMALCLIVAHSTGLGRFIYPVF